MVNFNVTKMWSREKGIAIAKEEFLKTTVGKFHTRMVRHNATEFMNDWWNEILANSPQSGCVHASHLCHQALKVIVLISFIPLPLFTSTDKTCILIISCFYRSFWSSKAKWLTFVTAETARPGTSCQEVYKLSLFQTLPTRTMSFLLGIWVKPIPITAGQQFFFSLLTHPSRVNQPCPKFQWHTAWHNK